MKIYAFSGLGVDERLFQYLELEHELIPILWIKPKTRETLEGYAKRIAKDIDTKETFGLLGVSFGGLIATEISKFLKPMFTILISSAQTRQELRPIYRWIDRTKIVNILPSYFFKVPRFIACYAFGTRNKTLLYPILEDLDPAFAKWAIGALLSWKNREYLNQMLKISGSKDKILPAKKHKNTILISNEGHFIIADKAPEISQQINTYVSEINKC